MEVYIIKVPAKYPQVHEGGRLRKMSLQDEIRTGSCQLCSSGAGGSETGGSEIEWEDTRMVSGLRADRCLQS